MLCKLVPKEVLDDIGTKLVNIFPLAKPSNLEEGTLLNCKQFSEQKVREGVDWMDHQRNLF